jgi:hypothetical protein
MLAQPYGCARTFAARSEVRQEGFSLTVAPTP